MAVTTERVTAVLNVLENNDHWMDAWDVAAELDFPHTDDDHEERERVVAEVFEALAWACEHDDTGRYVGPSFEPQFNPCGSPWTATMTRVFRDLGRVGSP